MGIIIKNANLKLGGKALLDDISLSFECGCFTMILGPNGAGKSSMLKVINGELAASTHVSFYDKSRRDWHPKELAQSLAVLPQFSNLSFNFTVKEVVELGGLTLTATRAQIQQIAKYNMEQTGVAQLANRLYPSLSGGEQQRVHLARILTQVAMSPRAPILMLDEPTSALDLAHQHHTLALLQRLAHNGAGVVAVVHDLNLAAQYANRLILLNEGKVVADGSPAEVLSAQLIEHVYHYPVQILPHPQHNYPVVIA
ncbi:MAG: heme ABC transporter ATP-binding protein [Enterovibrio sp.]